MSFEKNFIKSENNNESSLVLEREKGVGENLEKKEMNHEFLYGAEKLRSFKLSKKPEERAIYEAVEKKVEELTKKSKLDVFDTIIKLRAKGETNWKEKLLEENIDKLIKKYGYSDETLLVDLNEETLGQLLQPLRKELRENTYVARDRVPLGKFIKEGLGRAKDDVLVFHVSPEKIKDGLKPGKNENYIYFSSDLKRLFNLNTAKYIYALRVDKSRLAKSLYCAANCFHRILATDVKDYLIEDSIKIFSEGDPGYRKSVLDSLGADFNTSYSPASGRAESFMKQKNQEEDRFSL
ncbi:MAG: hypothetical protein WCZ15_02715 [Patescibacteria group bacterium]